MVEEASTYCAAHPDVETGLRCNRCNIPICPRCLVQTPVGARCRPCANLRRPPMYELGPVDYLRGYGAAIGLGGVMGILWAFLLPRGLGFLGFFAFFLAMALGYVMAEAIERATNRKRGLAMQTAAVTGLMLAYVVRNLALGLPLLTVDLFGYIVVGVASLVAIGYLR